MLALGTTGIGCYQIIWFIVIIAIFIDFQKLTTFLAPCFVHHLWYAVDNHVQKATNYQTQ